MKKLLLLLASFSFITTSFAAFEVKPVAKKVNDVFLPVGNTGQKNWLIDLSKISVKDSEKVSGKHLSFFNRIYFKSAQKKVRNSVSTNRITNISLLRFAHSIGGHRLGFDVLGFLLGLFLGPTGVLFVYIVGGDKDVKKNRVRWAWIGLGALLVFSVIVGLLMYAG